ncbi:MAG TPA: neutral/alkaline non-lysosomal ceramidase N-terminal domain-containing protein, partial [Solirubrobacteraceae bacterium]|nr:neutral/alkaline non-lysosomal ceramidase N-terminal domain-containing protein [Solirubrobacteraceae bacterium]
MRRTVLLAALLGVLAALPAAAHAGTLRAGAGRADVTPPTGYWAMGWVRSDAVLAGQHTRLFARALVLERDGRKVALVAADLGAIPGGMVASATDLLKDRGYSERNVLVSASHTHAAPTGFYNFSTYNTVFMTAGTPTDQNVAGELDPQLHAFMVRQLAEAIRRADDDLAPARAGWSSARLTGVTRNRSIEAHLHNHGLVKAFGEGRAEDDPLGVEHTIDPDVQVLRVDKVRRGRRVPIGMWTTFANHGTVNPYTFKVYNADHHGSATRVAEQAIRREGRVPRGQEVVNAYGNTDEGDMSAGLERRGPAWADEVGRREAAAMLDAWRVAGRSLSAEPALDLRWTRVCFCGQATEGGEVDDEAVVGLPLFTGSEEGRGPLYDQTGVPFEDRRSPTADPHQGHKVQVA